MRTLDLVIDSCYANIELAGSCIEFLASKTFDNSSCHQIQLCVVEAITNCIEHSYEGENNHKITIRFGIDPTKLIIDIFDTGKGMTPQEFDKISPDFDFDPLDLDLLLEGGRGLKIIKAWMDEAYYYIDGGVNHLSMVKYTHSPTNRITASRN